MDTRTYGIFPDRLSPTHVLFTNKGALTCGAVSIRETRSASARIAPKTIGARRSVLTDVGDTFVNVWRKCTNEVALHTNVIKANRWSS